MLCEIECRALSAAHTMLIQDFEPRDALTYLENQKIFTEDHTELISTMTTRLERIRHFLRTYRRQASDLEPLIEFFKYNNQRHLSEFLEDYIETAINRPEELRPIVIARLFHRQMLDRKLLLGNVPKHMALFARDKLVDRLVTKLDRLSQLDSFFLFVHGRAGSGKSVIAAQALAKSDDLIGICYDSVIWLKDGGMEAKSTFDLFSDLLLMLKRARVVCDTDPEHFFTTTTTAPNSPLVFSRSEDDLLNFPSVDHVTSVVLKKMIANALIDRPNTLVVLDDVVQEETIRWAQELRLRCLVTSRDIEISNAASSPTCEYVEVTPFTVDECYDFFDAYGMPVPVVEREEDVLEQAILASSGNPAVLMMMFKSCEPKTYEKLAQLTLKMESRGLGAVECITPYAQKSLPAALQRCVEVLSDEDRSALAFSVVMPPGVDIPIKLWSTVIPVDLVANEPDSLEEEVADRLKRLSKRGALLSGKREPVLTFRIDHIIHSFLRHVVDANTIKCGIRSLEEALVEMSNNNTTMRSPPIERLHFRRTAAAAAAAAATPSNPDDVAVIRPEDFPKFMQIHRHFYETLKKFVGLQ